jgi:hypothetical protein
MQSCAAALVASGHVRGCVMVLLAQAAAASRRLELASSCAPPSLR